MTDSEEFQKYQRLVQTVEPGGKLRRTWDLKGGISAGMKALEVECPDGGTKKLIVRRPGDGSLRHNPNAAEDEFKLLQTMRSLGLATQTPYFLDESGQIFPTPYLVIGYIEGRVVFAPADITSYIEQFSAQLARIHAADCSHLDLSFLPGPAERFDDRFGNRPTRMDGSLEEGRIRDELPPAWPFPQRNAPALLHGDYWPGNVLWQGDRLAAVIDWEDARLGDPLSDLAISRLDVLWIFGLEAMQDFTRHYLTRNPVDTTSLPYWDLAAALRLARLVGANLKDWVEFFHPYDRRDITEGTLRNYYHYFIDQAFGKLRD